ncbi:uncharacterized protein LOC103852411 [Brassica rapa]|uniref:Phorbol-ester/DAG-type domain-containing protein n=1 Tax=Brassica campestris TaxID=3711 RepID=M4EYU8_BRACM|nr:uncharacterized protein LOC103852411 [Brassica rapa]
MVKLKHGAHECLLTSPEIIDNGICNICFKDEPIEFACDLCNFDLCRACSKLPLKVSHDFHPDHPLEFCLGKKDGNERYKLCSGCGDLFSDQSLYYKCKDCEIFLDLGCAILNNTKTSWYAEEKLHYSHAHFLRRCKPGPDARGSCLMCELPLTPSAVSYGCSQCYLFAHERCLDLPREIQHPVHQAHPLTRLDFTHTCGGGKVCDACGLHVEGAPLSCLECSFYLHLRCADSLLRGLVHKSHQHKLFYLANNAKLRFKNGCRVCMRDDDGSYGDYLYHCVECGWRSHFKCLEIPESVVNKSYHIHPLVCKIFLSEDDSLEYCDVCETMVHAGHHAYCCEECGFLSHIECILHEEMPSPLYLKDLYSHLGEKLTRPADHDDKCETKELENKLVVIDVTHNHVLRSRYVTASQKGCWICYRYIHGRLWKCETCRFEAHDNCIKLSQQSRYRFHLNHPLTLLPSYPAGATNMRCDTCKEKIDYFNLFCRICDFIICTKCAVSVKMRLGELQRGQKFIRYEEGKFCLKGGHDLVQVMVSRSYMVACTLCDDRLCNGNIVSCPDCEEIYHSQCIELWRRYRALENHPLHYNHILYMIKRKTGSKCTACKPDIDISKYVFFCSTCSLSFHFKCIQAVGISTRIKTHKHCLYNFLSDDSSRPCTICNKPCGASFYACDICNVCAHEECIGFPTYVKNQRHQHIVNLKKIYAPKICSICGLDTKFSGHKYQYTCDDCKDVFHTNCIMSMVEREAATEEEQISDLSNMLKDMDESDEEDSDSS